MEIMKKERRGRESGYLVLAESGQGSRQKACRVDCTVLYAEYKGDMAGAGVALSSCMVVTVSVAEPVSMHRGRWALLWQH